MVQYLYDKNIINYTFAILGGLGLLIRLIVNLVYKHLVKESDNLGETKNKMLRHMKMKFETCYKLKIGVNNVDTFVDKNVLRYRISGILLSTWENLSGQVLLINFLLIPVSTVFGVAFECGQDVILSTGAVGILTGSILILVDKMINLSSKKQIMRLNLMDYLENFCKVRLEQETFHPELLEQYRKEFFQATEVNRQVSAAPTQTKEEAKNELNRRREARLKKEEEKRAQAIKREEEQRKIELARKEDERKRMEERKRIAAKRREEELRKLEEEREALELRRAELKRKAEEKLHLNEKRQQQTVEKDKILHSIEEEFAATKKPDDMDQLLKGMDEIAADKDQGEKAIPTKEQATAKDASGTIAQSRNMNPEEEKIFEDIKKQK
jgi:hypothetical protein